MLEQLEKLEKKVSYEKYMIEVQLKERHSLMARNLNLGQQGLNLPGENALHNLREEIATALQTETIETMLAKIQTKGIGRVKPGRVRVMKNVRIHILDPTTPNSKELIEQGHENGRQVTSADNAVPSFDSSMPSGVRNKIDSPTTTYQNLSVVDTNTSDGGLTFAADQINANTDEAITMGHTPIEYELEDCDIKHESTSYGNIEKPIPPLVLNPLKMELESTMETNETVQSESDAAGSNEVKSSKFICGVCKAQFGNNVELENHATAQLCLPSHSRTKRKTDLPLREKRIAKPSVQTKVKCPICSKWRGKRSHLIQHIKTHEIKYPRKCSECGNYVSNYKEWLRHLKEVHPGKFKCTVCQRTYQWEKCLKRHMLKAH